MKRFPNFSVALFLTAIYFLIIMGPLAPLAMRSPVIAHAMTGECAGNCDICGCSAERRANHTCCCWQKKLKHAHEPGNFPECCKKKQRHRMPMLSHHCPCGGSKQPGICGPENSEHLPYRFIEGAIAVAIDAQFSANVNRLPDRLDEPPDPPPKTAFF